MKTLASPQRKSAAVLKPVVHLQNNQSIIALPHTGLFYFIKVRTGGSRFL